MKLSIIILNYNTVHLLRDCINNLQDIWSDYEIIVADNASPDGSAQMVRDEFSSDPRIKLVAQKENLGISVSTNAALQIASGNYILHLGTDAYPTKEAIKALIDFMEAEQKVGMCTARLVTRNGKPDMDAHRGFPTPWVALTHFAKLNKLFPKSKLFNGYFMGWEDLNTIHDIDMCISHFMLIRREVYQDIKGWDEDYFVFGEDVDICYRTKQFGWHIVYVGTVEVLHYKGAGVGRKTSADIKTASATPEVKEKMVHARADAMRLFYKKHLMKKYFILALPVLFLIWFLEQLRLLKLKFS